MGRSHLRRERAALCRQRRRVDLRLGEDAAHEVVEGHLQLLGCRHAAEAEEVAHRLPHFRHHLPHPVREAVAAAKGLHLAEKVFAGLAYEIRKRLLVEELRPGAGDGLLTPYAGQPLLVRPFLGVAERHALVGLRSLCALQKRHEVAPQLDLLLG